ncbi:MAG TPA: UDP-3-O-[3-hydroxymyristoyl] N-acetylglucosamine deacetylase, partial [Alphaproteobacteria bacterium]|nr:UDP-3-O-[3-hydroxymyristoyl] N-acetylglucosamine deacetylase [Alphaproteobacteria bacterium]
MLQKTIKSPISCTGIGLHSGINVNMALRPAPVGTGIVFTRIDQGNALLPAAYDLVAETRLGTTLRNGDGVGLAAVEHLMAALWGCEIDNLFVDIDGPEVPAMDGSAAPFVFLMECAGVVEQGASRQAVRVCRSVEVIDGDKRIALTPADDFSVDLLIDFDNP